jgi:colanic acid/amylovoran biosynthesis glycosyltransferase
LSSKIKISHLIRKIDHFNTTPFIRTQILNHSEYSPLIITKEYDNDVIQKGKNNLVLFLKKKNYLSNLIHYKLFRNISNENIREISEFCGANDIKLLHFHYGTDAGIYCRFLKVTRIPSIVSFYGYDCSSFPQRFLGLGKHYLRKRVFKNVTYVLAMSSDMKNDLIQLGCPTNKILVHYFGIDIRKFTNNNRDYGRNNNLKLLIMASLEDRKGHIFLLKALVELIRKGVTNFNLKIIGQGILEHKLKLFVSDNKLSSYVQFIPSIDYNTEIVSAYSNADIYVQPSVTAENGDKEGIPTALLEAMTNGLPVVSTYHAGIPDIIENKINGLLVKESNVHELTQALEALLNSRSLRENLGKAAQDYAVKNLDLKVKQIELELIYRSLISRNER